MKKNSKEPAAWADNHFQLRLYVAGQTPKSLAALSNLKRICATHLEGRYRIEVIDLMKNPQLAQGDQILAIPTLVRNPVSYTHLTITRSASSTASSIL